MTKAEAATALNAMKDGNLPPGIKSLGAYASASVRMKPDDLRRAEVIGERRITRSRVVTVKGGGVPDTLQTITETISVFDTLAH